METSVIYLIKIIALESSILVLKLALSLMYFT
eukprot:UN19235